ncbi:Glucosyltransferase-SI precursor [Canna indica]|uniref:Glucosyltransferase-SI n=1 Tax=Canna indica TaxID=4628 RepID=A0AAQ3KUX0_9LILI|nr:Glucosyltransferase-SI precursor [Canna indica]
MGACATKPKVMKDEANAPLTRESAPETAAETKLDETGEKPKQAQISDIDDKDDIVVKEVEVKESTNEGEQVAVAEQLKTETAKEEVKPGVAAAVSISLIEKSIEVVENCKPEQEVEKAEEPAAILAGEEVEQPNPAAAATSDSKKLTAVAEQPKEVAPAEDDDSEAAMTTVVEKSTSVVETKISETEVQDKPAISKEKDEVELPACTGTKTVLSK